MASIPLESALGASQALPSGVAARRQSSLPLLQTKTCRLTGDHSTFTPPDTPTSPQSGLDGAGSQELLFHNYLRAFHPFEPSPEDEASSITVPIKQGDLILVHSVHANGWADGTLLTTGARGWLPTNYCEAYDHPYMRNLLNAMTQFWDLLGDNENASFSTFVRQDYIRGLIAGVRYLLEHTNCLHRGAALVLRHVGIRRMRKGLLADLSLMVQKAKELQEEASQPYAGEVIHIVLDELITKAFKVVTRAVRFVDTWTQESSNSAEQTVAIPEPPTPPVEADGTEIHSKSSALTSPDTPQDSARHALDRSRKSTPGGRASQIYGSVAPSPDEKRRSAILVRSDTASHRLSLVKDDSRRGVMASEQLAQAHDVCISLLGQFLGLHMQSRSPTELFDNTQRLVDACKRLIAIMDQVYPRDTGRVMSMQQSQVVFQTELEALVISTKEVFTFSDLPDEEVVIIPEQISRLVANGTRLIRAVGECVANTRRLLEQAGDFELDQPRMAHELQGDEGLNGTFPRSAPKLELPSAAEGEAKGQIPLAQKALPAPPPLQPRMLTTTAGTTNTVMPCPSTTTSTQATPDTPFSAESHTSLNFPTKYHRPFLRSPVSTGASAEMSRAQLTPSLDAPSSGRKDSVSTFVMDASNSFASGLRNSQMTVVSEASTGATTPERRPEQGERKDIDPKMLSSFGSISSITSAATDISNDADGTLLQKSFAHELILNQQGQVAGGSLQALVEQLTTHDSTPDPHFVTTFYLTFRLFTSPRLLAQTLIERFEYIGDGKTVGVPVRLRICNFFKGWLENYWNSEVDKEALGDVRFFALHKLKPHLPSAADRLLDATRRLSSAYQNGAVSLSGLGRTMALIGAYVDDDSLVPEPAVSKAQLNILRQANLSVAECHILDMEAVEIARQLTLITSRIYCSIQPDELLSLSWNKKGSDKGFNVRNLSKLNTDLSYVVNDSILSQEEVKKRAQVIKRWVKVAMRCQELRNYESLLAIVASLMSSYITRLKKTWELVSKKTKGRFEELKAVIDPSGNNASLRRRIEETAAPSVPFLGVHLTDLTFVDAGNPATRAIPNTLSASGEPITVINFDKYARMAKIVTGVQRFQVSYNLQAVPELQTWLDSYLNRMREAADEIERSFSRRSQALEPRQSAAQASRPADMSRRGTDLGLGDERPRTATGEERRPDAGVKDQIGFFMKHNGFGFKAALSRYDLPAAPTVTPQPEQQDAVEGASRQE